MRTFASQLTHDDIQALADYFSRQSGLAMPRR